MMPPPSVSQADREARHDVSKPAEATKHNLEPMWHPRYFGARYRWRVLRYVRTVAGWNAIRHVIEE